MHNMKVRNHLDGQMDLKKFWDKIDLIGSGQGPDCYQHSTESWAHGKFCDQLCKNQLHEKNHILWSWLFCKL